MFEYDVGFHGDFLLGPVRAVRALELGLDSALEALVPPQVLRVFVRPEAVLAVVSLGHTCGKANTQSG